MPTYCGSKASSSQIFFSFSLFLHRNRKRRPKKREGLVSLGRVKTQMGEDSKGLTVMIFTLVSLWVWASFGLFVFCFFGEDGLFFPNCGKYLSLGFNFKEQKKENHMKKWLITICCETFSQFNLNLKVMVQFLSPIKFRFRIFF